MPPIDKVNRAEAIGMLDAGLSQGKVARRFGMHRITIYRLVGRLIPTTDQDLGGHELRHIPKIATFDYASYGIGSQLIYPFRHHISSRTVLRRLAAVGIRPRRSYRGPHLTQRHLLQRLDWARRQFR